MSKYLNSLPAYRTDFCDITDLSDNKADVSAFMSAVLNGQSAELRHTAQLPAIRMPLGFPVLFMQKGNEEQLVAPLFLWEVEVTEAGVNRIIRYNGKPAKVNSELVHYLTGQYGESFDWLRQSPQNLSENQLKTLCIQLSEKLELLDIDYEEEIRTLPNNALLYAWSKGKGRIHWSGLLGDFGQAVKDYVSFSYSPSPSAPIVQESSPVSPPPEPSTSQVPKKSNLSPICEHHFSGMETDPLQTAALRDINTQADMLFYGSAGTGKTYTLVAALTNLLTNKRRALVVAKNETDLKKIKRQIEQQGLAELALTIKEPFYNKNDFATGLRNHYNAGKNNYEQNNEVQILLNKNKRQTNVLNEGHKALNRHIFGDSTWSGAVGHFLHNHADQERELLDSQLSVRGYQFKYDEYQQLDKDLMKCSELYETLNTLNHPLEALNPDIFQRYEDMEEARQSTVGHIETLSNEAKALYHEHIGMIESYGRHLYNHYQSHYELTQTHAQDLHDAISDNATEYGEDFKDTGTFKNTRLRLAGLFSKQKRQLLDRKKQLQDEFELLKKQHAKTGYFNFSFGETGDFESTERQLEDYQEALNDWKKGIPRLVGASVQNLNAGTAYAQIGYQEKLKTVGSDYKDFISKVNDIALFEEFFNSDDDTLLKRKKYLEILLDKLEILQYNVRDFDIFYQWKRHWTGLGENSQRLVKAMTRVRPSNWKAAFESWYFHHLLNREYVPSLPHNNAVFDDYTEEQNTLKAQLPNKVKADWFNIRNQEISLLKQQNSGMFNDLFVKKATASQSSSLDRLFEDRFELLLSVYPLILATPEVVNKLLPDRPGAFDLVAFENAHELSYEESKKALRQSDRRWIMAAPNLSTSDSLPNYVEQKGFRKYELNTPYSAIQISMAPRISAAEKDRLFVQTSLFADEIAKIIGKDFPSGQIKKQQMIDDIPVELVVRPAGNNKPVAILCDSFFTSSPAAAYSWERQRRTALTKQGYKIYDCWSVNWWKEPEAETEKLIDFLKI